MDLGNNPFNVIGASPRDDRRRIVELAEERSLHDDAERCNSARSELTSPRKRLAAEVAWMPGLAPRRAQDLLGVAQASLASLVVVPNVPPLARANLIATGLGRPTPDVVGIVQAIIALAEAYEQIDLEDTLALVNDDRSIAGFPAISEEAMVAEELENRRRYYRVATKNSLERLKSDDLVAGVTRIVDLTTQKGTIHAPTLVDDLVDMYEMETQEFLNSEESNIDLLLGQARARAESGAREADLAPTIEKLMAVLRNWDRIAQPIQVSTMSRGMDHDASQRVAYKVRDLAIYLFNKHGMLETSRGLTRELKSVFAEVIDVAELADSDQGALDDIAGRNERKRVQRNRELQYEVQLGAVFKKTFRIDGEAIYWSGKRWPLESIASTRWGATRHYVNGIYTGTTHKICFGDTYHQAGLETRKDEIYEAIIDKLWKGVCTRHIDEYLRRWQANGTLNAANSIIRDEGIEITRFHLFGGSRARLWLWRDVEVESASGSLHIRSRIERKDHVSLSFQEENNIHVLSAILSSRERHGCARLSDLLK